jgi:hypothetical protein
MDFAFRRVMPVQTQLKEYVGRRITRRLYRSVPWIGSLVALLSVGRAIRRKGLLGGTAHTVLDFIPFVGAAKNIVEIGRGRDLIADKPIRQN